MHKYVTEFIGTFFLVLTIGLTATAGLPLAPLAIGAVLMVMVYMGGHISGAHYNPAVSVAVLMRGKMASREFVPYILSQLVGACSAALIVLIVTGETFAPAPAESAGIIAPLLVEILYTFALALVILNVATAPATEGNSFYGLAIGFTIVGAAFAGGPISGGAFNPAVGVGPTVVHAVMGDGSWQHLWLYLVGPVIGGALSAGIYSLQHQNSDDNADDPA